MIIRPCSVADVEQAGEMITEYSGYTIEGLPMIAVQWDRYKALESAKAITLLGVFVEDRLVGFTVLCNQISMHYGSQTTIAESLFVMKAFRKTQAGFKLLTAMYRHAKESGSAGIIIVAPFDKELQSVLPRMGYAPSHTMFFKAV